MVWLGTEARPSVQAWVRQPGRRMIVPHWGGLAHANGWVAGGDAGAAEFYRPAPPALAGRQPSRIFWLKAAGLLLALVRRRRKGTQAHAIDPCR